MLLKILSANDQVICKGHLQRSLPGHLQRSSICSALKNIRRDQVITIYKGANFFGTAN